MAYRFNPFTGNFDFVAYGASSTEPIQIPQGFEATCTSDEQVGDPVLFTADVTDPPTVERLTSNVYDSRLVVGVIYSKASPTTCFVVTLGVLQNITSGLSQGQPVWIDTDGGLTTTRPTTGHLQIIGDAIGPSSVSVNIEKRKTILA